MESNEEKEPITTTDNSQEIIMNVSLEEVEIDSNETNVSENEIESLSKSQLIEKLAEYLDIEETNSIFKIATIIKSRIDAFIKEEYEEKLKVFIQDGSLPEDFEPKVDALDKKAEEIWKNINSKRINQRKQKEKSAQDNLSTKKMILEELKELLKGNEKYTVSYNKFQALQSKWRTTGNVPLQDNATIRENYYFLTGKFYDMVKISNELNDLDKKKSGEHKLQLCEKAELLTEEKSIKKAVDGMRLLQEEWSEIRNTPKEVSDNLWNRFKIAADKINVRQKEYNQKLKEQLQANLVAKTDLCVQMEQLLQAEFTSHKACRDASEKENALWEVWQKISFVPKSDNGNCWTRFKNARVQLHQTMDLFYANQRNEYSSNLEKKIALCINAETLQESTEWITTAEVLKKLQTEWKTIGQVAKKDSDAVWNRFRKACDHFFERKNNQVAEKENALKANIQAKELLISKANLFQPSEDINQSIEDLKKLQEEWNLSGETPFKENERLNNTFGKAIENLLERMKTISKVDDKLFYRLKYEQMLKSPQGIDQIKKERFVFQDKIKKLQTEVDQLENNLSFFGKSKSSNPLIAEQQNKLDKFKLEVVELKAKLKLIPVAS